MGMNVVFKKYLLIVPIPFLFCILMICWSLQRVRKIILKLKSFLISELDMKDLGVSKKILRIEIHHDRGVENCGYRNTCCTFQIVLT